MPQIFPKGMNPLGRMIVLGLPMSFALVCVGLAAFYRSSYATGKDEVVPQPVAFSHQHHVAQLGIDCRYCHTSVEDSSFASIPPTKTCMNCHQQIWTSADLLEPVRKAYYDDKPIQWNRVHNLPHYAYFNHSIHVAKGVGCQSCHGQIDEMRLTMQSKTLLMEWCISCHRNPQENLRPKSEVFSMTWAPGQTIDGHAQTWKREDLPNWGLIQDKDGKWIESRWVGELVGKERKTTQAELGPLLKEVYGVRDAVTLTGCSMCHR
ncbi:MAG TPA: cytochrome c3 family protein [Gemmataceae bacterium]